jgi:hypothetical protein
LSHAVASYAYLLECTLATYVGLVLAKRSSKGEIRRHESIITTGFTAMWSELCAGAPELGRPIRQACPRVLEIVAYRSQGDNAEEACARYFLALRQMVLSFVEKTA